jgi:hypothetical protein
VSKSQLDDLIGEPPVQCVTERQARAQPLPSLVQVRNLPAEAGEAAGGSPTTAAPSTANPRSLTIDLLLDLRDERAPRDLPFCEQESRVRFVPWQLTGTSWTPFEGAIGQAISMTSTLPWRAAIRHAKMAERAYVRVQRET